MKIMKYIHIYDRKFVVQSYKKDEYCYLVSPDDDFSSIRIEFLQTNKNFIFSSNQKTDPEWLKFVVNLNLESLMASLNELFNYSE